MQSAGEPGLAALAGVIVWLKMRPDLAKVVTGMKSVRR